MEARGESAKTGLKIMSWSGQFGIFVYKLGCHLDLPALSPQEALSSLGAFLASIAQTPNPSPQTEGEICVGFFGMSNCCQQAHKKELHSLLYPQLVTG
jgi:hypothetical protein